MFNTRRRRRVRQGAAMGKIRVGILGATGTVGQRFLQLLEQHPQFTVTALAASDRSEGKPYATTLQAISGAGYPGVAALDITDNVIPFIAEEEEKIERETRKILGSLEASRVTPATFAVSAQCHRVNVVDGHLAAVRVKLARAAEPAELREAFASFTALPQELRLPSAPERPIVVRD